MAIEIILMNPCKLRVQTWRGLSPEATHFYGYVSFSGKQEELKFRLNQAKADEINLHYLRKGLESHLRAGCRFSGFDTVQEVIDYAINHYQEYFPQADCLYHDDKIIHAKHGN